MESFQIKPNTAEDNVNIHQMLRAYNAAYMQDGKDYSFHISENGVLAAGIVAGSVCDTLEVEFLFVKEPFRGKGYGQKLLSYVEDCARQDGLQRILLNTYSFQAPGFYRKLGYIQQFQIHPCFGSQSQFFFVKTLR